MSSKRGFLNRSAALAAGVGFAALMSVALASPALADNWKHHHGPYKGPGYVVAPGYFYGGYYAPPPVVYYPPEPVYVAAPPPPPVFYAPPPPVYYGPPSLNFGINIPLR